MFALEPGEGRADCARRTWSWRAANCPGLPDHMRERFGATDECKPVNGGRDVLITSSGGGVALVDRGTGAASFWATAANAHSADLLPGGRLAVAASHAPEGDRLILFDLAAPEAELHSVELPCGHGVVWDEQRQTLWALSNVEVRGYRLEGWDSQAPSLALASACRLPESGGHDLQPVPGTAMLSVTTAGHCWHFDRDTGLLGPHPQLGQVAHVKCISVHPESGRLVYVQADEPEWWSDRLRFLAPEGEVRFPGERLYKARWETD